MSDIERRLRELGERNRADEPAAHLPPQVTRRVKRRRLATVATSVLVTAALAFGGAVAVGAFESPQIGPAEGRTEVLIDYHRTGGFAGEDTRLIVRSDGTASVTIAEGGEFVTTEHETTDDYVRAVKAALAAVDWPAAAAERRFGPMMAADAIQFELRHEDYVVSGYHRAKSRDRVDDLVALLDALLRNLQLEREPESRPVCADRIDFVPTYVPEGWTAELQKGGAGGEDPFGNIAGHYGVEASASNHEKVDAGFINVVALNFRFEPPSDGDLTVLGLPAEFDEENGTVEFGSEGCAYALVGAGVGREQLVPFAEGLRPKRNSQNRSNGDESFSAIWPDDTLAEAKASCAAAGGDRDNPVAVAVAFVTGVLGWDAPEQLVLREASQGRRDIEIRRSPDDDGPRADGPAVMVHMNEVLDGCWSVGSVSRLPDKRPTGVGVGVTGRKVSVGFDDLGASSVTLIVGHGEEEMRVNHDSGKSLIQFRLDYAPHETGHFLLLFRDDEGRVFSASGGPLPAGDFAAG